MAALKSEKIGPAAICGLSSGVSTRENFGEFSPRTVAIQERGQPCPHRGKQCGKSSLTTYVFVCRPALLSRHRSPRRKKSESPDVVSHKQGGLKEKFHVHGAKGLRLELAAELFGPVDVGVTDLNALKDKGGARFQIRHEGLSIDMMALSKNIPV